MIDAAKTTDLSVSDVPLVSHHFPSLELTAQSKPTPFPISTSAIAVPSLVLRSMLKECIFKIPLRFQKSPIRCLISIRRAKANYWHSQGDLMV